MPFHIRLVNQTNPQIAKPVEKRATGAAVLAEFAQGIAFGVGVGLIMLTAFWFAHAYGIGV